jgi:hypothetical protein
MLRVDRVAVADLGPLHCSSVYAPPIDLGAVAIHIDRMVTISFTTEAFAGIEATLPRWQRITSS